MSRIARKGFTLIELLVIIAIIAVLIAIVLPALSRARQQAQSIQCQSNERQILMSVFMYADSNRGCLPLPTYDLVSNFSLKEPRAAIDMNVAGQYDWTNGTLWPYVGVRDPLARQRLFNCPSDPDPKNCPTTFGLGQQPSAYVPRNFSYNFNQEMYVARDQRVAPFGVRLTRVKGASHKIFVVEEWAPTSEASDLFLYMVELTYLHHPLTTVRHSGFANIGMADGHVEPFGPEELPISKNLLTTGQAATATSDKYDYYCALPH